MNKLQNTSLPNNWNITELKNLVEVKSGKRLPKGEPYSENLKKYPYIRIIDFQNCTVRTKNLKYLTPELHEKLKQYIITDKDVYLAIVGSTIGLVNNLILNQDYLIYYLASNLGQREIHKRKTVTSVPKLAFKRIEKIPVIIPPILEQQNIISILSNVDDLIFYIENIINQLRILKKGLMQRLFTKGIGNTLFKDTRLGKIPKEWDIVKLEDVINIKTDYVANGSFASLRENVKVFDTKNYALYVRLFDIRKGLGNKGQKYVDESSYKFLKKSSLYGGEILIANIGAYTGEPFLMPMFGKPATLAPNMILLKLKEDMVNYFLFYYLKSNNGKKALKRMIGQSGQPKMNKTELKTVTVIKPSLLEQRKIANYFQKIDYEIEYELNYQNKLKKINKGLMQDLLTGKKRVKLEI